MNATPTKLGELCTVVTKGTTPTSLGYDFSENGIPFLRIQNISNNSVSLSDILFIDQPTHDALARSKIKAGDFLISIAGTIGRTAIVPDGFPECNCNQAVAILRLNEDALSPRYLLHWLSTKDAINQIYEKKVTATISNLSLGQIKELEIPLPPLEKQKRIAAILDKADAIRHKRQEAIKFADEFLRAVFLDMFVHNTEKAGWEKVSINDVTLKVKTWNPLVNEELVFEYIDLSSVDNNSKKITDSKILEGKYAPSRARQLVLNGDVLASTVRPNLNGVAKVEKNSDFLTASTGFCVLRPNADSVTQNFLFHLVRSADFVSEMVAIATGASYPAVSDKIIKSYEFELPPLSVQHNFDKLCQKIESYQLRNTEFSKMGIFDSLSQKVFSGNV